MDKARNLFEELDLRSDDLYAKRKAEFDEWFDKPSVRLYEAVMLSLRIIPEPYYRLDSALPTSHPPRYPDEFFFDLQRVDFHDRMVRAIGAVRARALRGDADANSANDSEYRITLADFERWANRANLLLPPEWRRKAHVSADSKVTSHQRRELNNLLRIVRALMRAAGIKSEVGLLSLVDRTPLSVSPDSSAVSRAYHAIPLADKQRQDMSLSEKERAQLTLRPDDLIGIIAALASIDQLRIDLRPRRSGAKRIARLVDQDRYALGIETTNEPGIHTIETVVSKIRAVLVDTNTAKPN